MPTVVHARSQVAEGVLAIGPSRCGSPGRSRARSPARPSWATRSRSARTPGSPDVLSTGEVGGRRPDRRGGARRAAGQPRGALAPGPHPDGGGLERVERPGPRGGGPPVPVRLDRGGHHAARTTRAHASRRRPRWCAARSASTAPSGAPGCMSPRWASTTWSSTATRVGIGLAVARLDHVPPSPLTETHDVTDLLRPGPERHRGDAGRRLVPRPPRLGAAAGNDRRRYGERAGAHRPAGGRPSPTGRARSSPRTGRGMRPPRRCVARTSMTGRSSTCGCAQPAAGTAGVRRGRLGAGARRAVRPRRARAAHRAARAGDRGAAHGARRATGRVACASTAARTSRAWCGCASAARRGQTVTVRHAEWLEPDGSLHTRALRSAKATDTYVLGGRRRDEVLEPRFTFHGFRYAEVDHGRRGAGRHVRRHQQRPRRRAPRSPWTTRCSSASTRTWSGRSATTSCPCPPTVPSATSGWAGPATPRRSRRPGPRCSTRRRSGPRWLRDLELDQDDVLGVPARRART